MRTISAKMNRCLVLLLVVSLSARAQHGSSPGAGRAADSTQLVAFLDHFLHSFRSLDWEPFFACFSEEATAFFPPSAKFPGRASNKQEIGTIFRRVFEGVRTHGGGALTIEPKDQKIQMLDGVAIVTFLLEDPGMLGRRTLVCAKTEAGWRIVHLHASGVVQ